MLTAAPLRRPRPPEQVALAPAAWAGSWAQCLSQVLERTGVDELEDLEVSTLPLAESVREAFCFASSSCR